MIDELKIQTTFKKWGDIIYLYNGISSDFYSLSTVILEGPVISNLVHSFIWHSDISPGLVFTHMLTDCYEQLWAPLQNHADAFFSCINDFCIRFLQICLHCRNQIYSQTLPAILFKVLSLFPASILLEHGLTKEIRNQLTVTYSPYLNSWRTLWWILSCLGNVSSKCPLLQ